MATTMTTTSSSAPLVQGRVAVVGFVSSIAVRKVSQVGRRLAVKVKSNGFNKRRTFTGGTAPPASV